MTYNPINWVNKPSTKTPINTTNLGKMDKGIFENDISITSLRTLLGVEQDTYESTKTYAVGDLIVYNHTIYECVTAITTAEEFNSLKWKIVPILKF